MSTTPLPEPPGGVPATPPACKYCDRPMVPMTVPPMAAFDSPWIYVCFHDDCGYYERGWEIMEQQTGQRTSYRFKHDPFTGETGPLPIWAPEAMRDRIVAEDGDA